LLCSTVFSHIYFYIHNGMASIKLNFTLTLNVQLHLLVRVRACACAWMHACARIWYEYAGLHIAKKTGCGSWRQVMNFFFLNFTAVTCCWFFVLFGTWYMQGHIEWKCDVLYCVHSLKTPVILNNMIPVSYCVICLKQRGCNRCK
jgi:hypothetical protein